MTSSVTCCLEFALGSLGALIGIGQLFNTSVPLTVRRILGRALTTGGIALAAGSVLLLIPSAPVAAVVGLSAAMAVLGADGVERLMVRHFKIDRRERREDV